MQWGVTAGAVALLAQSASLPLHWAASNSGARVWIPIVIPVGTRFKSLRVDIAQGVGGDSSLTVWGDETPFTVRGQIGSTDTSTGVADTSLTVTSTVTADTATYYYAEFNFGSVAVSDAKLYMATLVVDRIA